MANRPANAGSGRGLAPMSNVTSPPVPPRHRAARPPGRPLPGDPGRPGTAKVARASGLAWVPYLIVLAGAAAGMFIVWQGSRYAGRGSGLVGCSMLAAGLARLILPPRYAGLLSTRRKASDVLAFAVFGAAVLAVALMLP